MNLCSYSHHVRAEGEYVWFDIGMAMSSTPVLQPMGTDKSSLGKGQWGRKAFFWSICKCWPCVQNKSTLAFSPEIFTSWRLFPYRLLLPRSDKPSLLLKSIWQPCFPVYQYITSPSPFCSAVVTTPPGSTVWNRYTKLLGRDVAASPRQPILPDPGFGVSTCLSFLHFITFILSLRSIPGVIQRAAVHYLIIKEQIS